MQRTRTARLLGNALLFQLGWFACVLGARHPWLLWLAAACLLTHLAWLSRPGEIRPLLAVSVCGWLVDSLLLNLGIFDFAGHPNLLPGWLVLLWPLFASTLRHSLAWSARPWWLASLSGALGGPHLEPASRRHQAALAPRAGCRRSDKSAGGQCLG